MSVSLRVDWESKGYVPFPEESRALDVLLVELEAAQLLAMSAETETSVVKAFMLTKRKTQMPQ